MHISNCKVLHFSDCGSLFIFLIVGFYKYLRLWGVIYFVADCSLGYGVDDMLGCVECPANTYRDATFRDCRRCPDGRGTNGTTGEDEEADCAFG